MAIKNRKSSSQERNQRNLLRKTSSQERNQRKALLDLPSRCAAGKNRASGKLGGDSFGREILARHFRR